ncbi:hypothetical protein ACFZBU_39500 [Embleya sp. NPDC008237]|uniref:hypothetical protein n=1 Tax=Embleya sp. NPDC008237 TaxID=3363978 RepID=UPI0036E16251
MPPRWHRVRSAPDADTVLPVAVADADGARVGRRVIPYTLRGIVRRTTIDPARYRCAVLAGQLGDEAVIYVRRAALAAPVAVTGAVRDFLRFVDTHLAESDTGPASATLGAGPIDMAEVVFAWECDLQLRYPPPSAQPNTKASNLLILLGQRAARIEGMPAALIARTRSTALFPRPEPTPLDEFTNAERLALQGAARSVTRAMEQRLQDGRARLREGGDPQVRGWHDPANLLWAAARGMLGGEALARGLGRDPAQWPPSVRAMAERAHRPGPHAAATAVVRASADALFPREGELQAFRILLLLTMGCTPEELLDLRVGDVEFGDGGVRVTQTKARAGRARARWHPGGARWDTAGLLRRLVDATEAVRRAHPDCTWLFALGRVTASGPARVRGDLARFNTPEDRFGAWIAEQRDEDGRRLVISLPHQVRRLRKTAKTAKVVALGGTLSDLAGDDHHVEVFRGHYAHGTTAHVLAGRAITTAQQRVFERATRGPILLDEAAVDLLDEPSQQAAVAMTPAQAAAMRAGELDMGLTHCRDPYDSPYTPGRSLCHVAPLMCMLCRNAVVFPTQLPRLVLLAEHIERMRAALAPPHWQAVWGAQAAALEEVFRECADLMPAARERAAADEARLDLPSLRRRALVRLLREDGQGRLLEGVAVVGTGCAGFLTGGDQGLHCGHSRRPRPVQRGSVVGLGYA